MSRGEWNVWLGIVGLMLTVAINIAHVGYTWGIVSVRLSHVEENVSELKMRMTELQSMSAKIAGIDAKLGAIAEQLNRLEGRSK